MSADHGNTPAAWTAVSLSLLGFAVGGLGLVLGPIWVMFWIGVALLPIAAIAGKVISATSGVTDERRSIDEPHQA